MNGQGVYWEKLRMNLGSAMTVNSVGSFPQSESHIENLEVLKDGKSEY